MLICKKDDLNMEAISKVRNGEMVICTKEEYQCSGGIRKALQNQAALWSIDGDAVRMFIALEEVKRLDSIFN